MPKRLKRVPIRENHHRLLGVECAALSTYSEATQEAVSALMASLEERDPYTFWHCVRVGSYCRSLAIELGFSESTIDDAELSGLLHDVGKMGIPDYILNKGDMLTAAEFAVMKSHAQRSAKLVSAIPGLDHLVPGILHHHERWDGHGYPNNLAAENIPLQARIILVADTFDAMTSTRPYRIALSPSVAIAELRRCQNTQFDERFSEAFCLFMEKELSLSTGKLKKIA